MRINIGTHVLKLFKPPVPEPTSIPIDDFHYQRDWSRYGNATVKIHIFQGAPRPGSLSPSVMSDNGDDVLPEVNVDFNESTNFLTERLFLKEKYI